MTLSLNELKQHQHDAHRAHDATPQSQPIQPIQDRNGDADEQRTQAQVTIRVHRFAPKAERKRERGSSPFGKHSSSPFGSAKRTRGKNWVQDYALTVSPDDTLLETLLRIKREIDPTLAFRYSCGHGMCGSDAVSINGTPALLCTAIVRDIARPERPLAADTDEEGFRKTGPEIPAPPASTQPTSTATPQHLGVIELAPLPGFPVQRDLIVDIDQMLEQIKRLKPYLISDGVLATTNDGKVDVFEFLQKPEALAKYEILTNCILCGVCEGACPVYSGGEAFVGPAALINQARFVRDDRDLATQERLETIDTADGINACQSVRACSRPCPKGIDVGEEVWQLIAQVKER
ncbi:succinate dehydrogenase/fumarate reductase iron-sulfur subunit [Bifidobacterium gallicum]|uniref:succinate dehydrogenase n=1 Tax=Bifidobacterium gallicum DSM 20093 = LMG 11596 TaxID=561180 RepID=D1NRZ5_9BIFI|nr:2Fe-2S iron-sulfur cluster-binding protein [Bifidobacterium gallicum]EFA23447.1 succinate dehydrogenase and fumarate reductase iron-sulfur protein [Bifidobacterium gallicum DSM 20093 = LMG 11596]KFI57262.1 (2Fe-2S)-binding protein [Bifidobacterium gallicum DSM 20093 = LMG 11596]